MKSKAQAPVKWDLQTGSIYRLLQTVHANQLVIIKLLQSIRNQENVMAVDLTSLTQQVTNNTSVSQSVVQLLQNLTTIINNIPPSNDPKTQAELDKLTDVLTQNDNAIAAAIVANTPAPAPSPTP